MKINILPIKILKWCKVFQKINFRIHNPNSNNYQDPSTDPVEEPGTEEPVEEPVIVDLEDPNTITPQNWATGDGTESNPWAGDCIKTAYNNCPAGGTVFLKAGYYQLSGFITINKKINIIGEGRNKTIVKTTDTWGFIVLADYVTIKGMTIDGTAQPAGEDLSCINLQNCDYILIEDIEAKNSFTGIQPLQVNNSIFRNIHTHHNEHLGMHPKTNVAGRNIDNTFQNIKNHSKTENRFFALLTAHEERFL